MSTNIADLPVSPPNPQPLAQSNYQPTYQPPPTVSTALPPRDIPQNTVCHTIDPVSVPSYMPPPPPQYIQQPQYMYPPTNPTQFEISDEFKVPILLFVMYYVFQLSFVNTMILRVLPDIFNASGHLTSNGILVKSILFGVFYYLVVKGLIYFS